MTKIISKDNCIFCTRAKALLDMKDIDYEELKFGTDIETLEEFQAMTGNAKSFPQIWLTISGADVHIGGYDKLVEHFDGA